MKWLAVLLVVPALAQEPIQGDLDLRSRFVSGDRGPVYRSVVNLGEGLRVFGGSLRYAGKDNVEARVHDWGGDPNSQASLRVRREGVYEVTMQYRTMAYFNSLPSFANPLLAQGVLTSQRSLDVRRRQLDLEARWKPRARVSPFFGILRTSGSGQGITPFTGTGDEFAVRTGFGDTLRTVRGGVVFTGNVWSAIVEQGQTSYTDRQDLDSGAGSGNRVDGIVLDRLTERYAASGSGYYTRANVQGQPLARLSVAGHYVFSRPKLDVSHTVDAAGQFLDPATRQPYTVLLEQSTANASQPRNSGSWTTEFRFHENIRARHTWFSDAFQISGASPSASLLGMSGGPRMRVNLLYGQSDAELIGDVGKTLTVRGGHRYVRGRADLPPADLEFTAQPIEPRMNRHVALAGASWRPWKGRVRLHADFEGSPGGATYFRTGLQNYRKYSAQGRVRLTPTLHLTVQHRALTNSNTGLDLRSRQSATTIDWSPRKAGLIGFSGTYAHESMQTASTIIDPTFFLHSLSAYLDRGHHASGYTELRLPGGGQISAGGAISSTGGTRPTRYYAPQMRVQMPVAARVHVVGEWCWYSLQSLDSFRAHTVSAGLLLRWRQ